MHFFQCHYKHMWESLKTKPTRDSLRTTQQQVVNIRGNVFFDGQKQSEPKNIGQG